MNPSFFPHLWAEGVNHPDGSGTLDLKVIRDGATLRDVFAAAVLVGLVIRDGSYDPALCWKIADQVLATRPGGAT